ncbi:MAG: hypothetical protein AB4058_09590 [Microcystaceae cyanobacterium]
MIQKKTQSLARRGRIVPEVQWSEEQWEQWKTETERFRQRCLPIFEQVKRQHSDTHYGSYVAVEPESGDYFISADKLEAMRLSQENHPKAKFFLFCLNETGVSGTI